MLKADSVQLEFAGRKILRDVSLQCQRGEVLGMLGRNGSGKSTLLKVIFGILTPSYKYISVDERVIEKGFVNGLIAYLPQNNFLPRYARVEKLVELMVTAEHLDEIKRMSIYQNHAHKRCEEVSGGELRQLEILMLLFSKADFILLDEPFTHVTPVQCETLKQLIRRVAETKGVIVTDHQFRNILDVSDRLVLMDDGVLRPINNHEDLVHYKYLSRL